MGGLAALLLTAPSVTAIASPASPQAVPAAAQSTTHVCDQAVKPGFATCFALKRTDHITPNLPGGYGPTDLRSAYNLTASGSGTATVAIVDSNDDPNAESDLATYRSTYGLPACTTANGCFKKVNENGQTSPLPAGDTGWAGEISLDVDMVSAICPACHILLVEANQPQMADLGTAVNTAVSMGAKYVSNSYGGSEDGTENSSDSSYFNHAGVAITASTGDSGFGVSYPASSQYVTAVGGTTLNRGGGTRGWSETVWSGAGSGCSGSVPKPSFQNGVNTSCANRGEGDVSAVADPATGVAVYQTYGGSGWAVYGGTSASAPIIASVYALAGTPGASDRPAAYPYSHTTNLYDVTSGNNGSCGAPMCTAGPGWDGPTGLGTPNGTAAFTAGGGPSPVSVTNPGSQAGSVGTAASLQLSATGGTSPYTWTATGLPAGLSISSGGLISGTPTTAGTYSVTATAKDSATPAGTGSATFSWTISGGGPSPVSVANPGSQTGSVGTAASLQLSATGGTSPYTWTATGLPAGLSINASTGKISGTPTTAGTYSVTATAKDSASPAGSGSTTFSWTISGGGGCTGQLFGNSGFESGNTTWSSTSGVIGQNGPSEPARTGTWNAWLDGYGSSHTDTLSQSVTIPANCHATLSFWLHIDTSETTTSTAYDKLTVKAGSTTLSSYSNLDKNTGYAQKTFDVSSMAGQTVTILFTGTEDSSLQTSFVIDDTAVTLS
ncbi:hypothetical protein F0L68_32140 [Solihabitans fulvus]|uniref:Peptidase S53 domain-containing protein n=1 Tax=Solihabitans fulvus TaxID=1892852 RepID=A0A5B2WSW1_9PSEU|nr:hypothetical protein F0L68_32140 [Solihabitans fulvus]